MIIYGAGGHAKVVLSCIMAMHQAVTAVFDDDESKKSISGKTVSGRYDSSIFPQELLIIAIGDNKLRRFISQKVSHHFGNVVHPSALIDTSVGMDQGSVVVQGCIIQSSVTIGRHVIVNTAARIDHDCKIEDFVHIAPGAVLCGNVSVGESTLVGAGCIIVPNVSIGRNCTIAAGSVVTKDIPSGCIVRGNPGRIIERSL
jgi:sugar O-acyltransferase (sialic acid O-acetyltransferase NeuD family)